MTLKQVANNHGLTPEGVDYALRQYPCIICKESPGPQCNAKRKGCWNRVLTKWMEGLDAKKEN